MLRPALLFFGVLLCLLHAQGYNENILKIEANIIPRIALMDYKFEQKLDKGKVSVLVLHTAPDAQEAKRLGTLIHERYARGISGYPILTRHQTYETFLASPQSATVYYLMDAPKEAIEGAVAAARERHTLTFAHNKDYLALGVNVSLLLDKKITPYINAVSLKQSNISLRPAFLSISEIYP